MYPVKVDTVTGAIAKELKSAVVEGALYSSYVLWYSVNGEIRKKIKKYTLKQYSTIIENQLLQSKNPRAVICALKKFNEKIINRSKKIL